MNEAVTVPVDRESRASGPDHEALRLWLRLLTCTSLMEAASVLADNLSLGATATANSSYFPPAYAIDGNNLTGWNAGDHGSLADPNWLVIDLGQVYSVAHMHVLWQEPDGLYAGFTSDYNFYASINGTDWALLASGTFIDEALLSDREFTLGFIGLDMRYAKYEVVGGTHWSHVSVVEIFGPVPEPASLLLLGTGLIGAVRAVRRRRGRAATRRS